MNTPKLSVGSTVIYSTSGICRVNNIVKRTFNNENREYYELAPIFDERSTCFVPVDYNSDKVHIEMALTEREAYALLEFAKTAEPVKWIELPNERKQQYGIIHKSGSREDKIKLLKTLYKMEKRLKEQNKQLHATDERILNGCKAQVFNELAFVLGKSADEIEELFVKFTDKTN